MDHRLDRKKRFDRSNYNRFEPVFPGIQYVRKRRNFSPSFKAKVALESVRGLRTFSESDDVLKRTLAMEDACNGTESRIRELLKAQIPEYMGQHSDRRFVEPAENDRPQIDTHSYLQPKSATPTRR